MVEGASPLLQRKGNKELAKTQMKSPWRAYIPDLHGTFTQLSAFRVEPNLWVKGSTLGRLCRGG